MLDHTEGWQRFNRTELYRELGVYWCADVLVDYGIERPAEQMVAICAFVTNSLGKASDMPHAKDKEEINRWARTRLGEVAEQWKRGDLVVKSWHWMLMESVATIAWNPYRELSALLDWRCGRPAFAQAVRQLQGKGFELRLDTAFDLENLFFRQRLPKAIRNFDPQKGAGHETKWLSTVFYRFALEELCSDRVNRLQVEFLDGSQVLQESAEDTFIRRETGQLADKVAESLSTLETAQRTALKLYFGFSGTEYRLVDIGRTLGVSEYRARNFVVQGLAALSVRLGVEGVLDDKELRFAQLLFIDGMKPAAAAQQLNIDKTAMSRRITNKFQRALRTRTMAAGAVADQPRSRESIMPGNGGSPAQQFETHFQAQPQVSPKPPLPTARVKATIADGLRSLTESPLIKLDDSEALVVDLGGEIVYVEAVRETVMHDHKLRAELKANDVPIAWLLDPSMRIERLDIPDDAAVRADLLDSVNQRRWVIAEVLYLECESLAERPAGELFDEEDRELSIERLFRTMAGVAQIIESTLSRDLRRQGEAVFRVEMRGKDAVVGSWLGADSADELDLVMLVHDRAEAVGEIRSEARTYVADAIVSGLLDGRFGLPGLHAADDATGDACSLVWHPPSLERELKADPDYARQRVIRS